MIQTPLTVDRSVGTIVQGMVPQTASNKPAPSPAVLLNKRPAAKTQAVQSSSPPISHSSDGPAMPNPQASLPPPPDPNLSSTLSHFEAPNPQGDFSKAPPTTVSSQPKKAPPTPKPFIGPIATSPTPPEFLVPVPALQHLRATKNIIARQVQAEELAVPEDGDDDLEEPADARLGCGS